MKRQVKVTDHVSFYKICECLQNRREQLTTERPTLSRARELIRGWIGLDCSEHTIKQAKVATGVDWQAKQVGLQHLNGSKRSWRRIITESVVQLYQSYGVEAPEALQAELNKLKG